VRDVCLRVALDAYERAGVGGLCAEGRWEMAVQAIRTRDLGAVSSRSQKVRRGRADMDAVASV